MKIREHRELLEDSLKTAVEIEPTIEAITEHINKNFSLFAVKPEDVELKPYCYDGRIEWDTHIVTIQNYGVFGFTDMPARI